MRIYAADVLPSISPVSRVTALDFGPIDTHRDQQRRSAHTSRTAAWEIVDRTIDSLAGNDLGLRRELEEAAQALEREDFGDEQDIADELWQRRQERVKDRATRSQEAERAEAEARARFQEAVETIPGAKVVGETAHHYVVFITRYEASRSLGSMNWCITRSVKHWKSYNKKGVLFYFYFGKTSKNKSTDRQPKGIRIADYAVAMSKEGHAEVYNYKDKLIPLFMDDMSPAVANLDAEGQERHARMQRLKAKIRAQGTTPLDVVNILSLVDTTTERLDLVASTFDLPLFYPVHDALKDDSRYQYLIPHIRQVLESASHQFPEAVGYVFDLHPVEVKRWAEMLVPVSTMQEAQRASFSAKEYKDWLKLGVKTVDRAIELRHLKLTPDTFKPWSRIKMTPDDIQKAQRLKITPTDIRRLRRIFSSDSITSDLIDFLDKGQTVKDAKAWVDVLDARVNVSDVLDAIKSKAFTDPNAYAPWSDKYSLTEACNIKLAGLDLDQVKEITKRLDPDVALHHWLHFFTRGGSVDTFHQLLDLGLDTFEISVYVPRNVNVPTLKYWLTTLGYLDRRMRAGEKRKVLTSIFDRIAEGWTHDDIRMWVEKGYQDRHGAVPTHYDIKPSDAQPWIDRGFRYKDAIFLHRDGVKPTDVVLSPNEVRAFFGDKVTSWNFGDFLILIGASPLGLKAYESSTAAFTTLGPITVDRARGWLNAGYSVDELIAAMIYSRDLKPPPEGEGKQQQQNPEQKKFRKINTLADLIKEIVSDRDIISLTDNIKTIIRFHPPEQLVEVCNQLIDRGDVGVGFKFENHLLSFYSQEERDQYLTAKQSIPIIKKKQQDNLDNLPLSEVTRVPSGYAISVNTWNRLQNDAHDVERLAHLYSDVCASDRSKPKSSWTQPEAGHLLSLIIKSYTPDQVARIYTHLSNAADRSLFMTKVKKAYTSDVFAQYFQPTQESETPMSAVQVNPSESTSDMKSVNDSETREASRACSDLDRSFRALFSGPISITAKDLLRTAATEALIAKLKARWPEHADGIQQLADADPTGDWRWLEWSTKQLRIGYAVEDIAHGVRAFYAHRDQLKDITKYSTLTEAVEAVSTQRSDERMPENLWSLSPLSSIDDLQRICGSAASLWCVRKPEFWRVHTSDGSKLYVAFGPTPESPYLVAIKDHYAVRVHDRQNKPVLEDDAVLSFLNQQGIQHGYSQAFNNRVQTLRDIATENSDYFEPIGPREYGFWVSPRFGVVIKTSAQKHQRSVENWFLNTVQSWIDSVRTDPQRDEKLDQMIESFRADGVIDALQLIDREVTVQLLKEGLSYDEAWPLLDRWLKDFKDRSLGLDQFADLEDKIHILLQCAQKSSNVHDWMQHARGQDVEHAFNALEKKHGLRAMDNPDLCCAFFTAAF